MEKTQETANMQRVHNVVARDRSPIFTARVTSLIGPYKPQITRTRWQRNKVNPNITKSETFVLIERNCARETVCSACTMKTVLRPNADAIKIMSNNFRKFIERRCLSFTMSLPQLLSIKRSVATPRPPGVMR